MLVRKFSLSCEGYYASSAIETSAKLIIPLYAGLTRSWAGQAGARSLIASYFVAKVWQSVARCTDNILGTPPWCVNLCKKKNTKRKWSMACKSWGHYSVMWHISLHVARLVMARSNETWLRLRDPVLCLVTGAATAPTTRGRGWAEAGGHYWGPAQPANQSRGPEARGPMGGRHARLAPCPYCTGTGGIDQCGPECCPEQWGVRTGVQTSESGDRRAGHGDHTSDAGDHGGLMARGGGGRGARHVSSDIRCVTSDSRGRGVMWRVSWAADRGHRGGGLPHELHGSLGSHDITYWFPSSPSAPLCLTHKTMHDSSMMGTRKQLIKQIKSVGRIIVKK